MKKLILLLSVVLFACSENFSKDISKDRNLAESQAKSLAQETMIQNEGKNKISALKINTDNLATEILASNRVNRKKPLKENFIKDHPIISKFLTLGFTAGGMLLSQGGGVNRTFPNQIYIPESQRE